MLAQGRFGYRRSMSGSYVAYDADIAPVAKLLSDSTRAAMLTALLDGRALTSGELARRAGVSAATASAHLARLRDGGLVTVLPQGRHRYYALAGTEVARVLEVMAAISPPVPVRGLRQSREARRLAAARACYDHLAGRAGVALLAALVARGVLVAEERCGDGDAPGNAYRVTRRGEASLAEFGVDVTAVRGSRRRFAYACLDRTERRPHLAGALGASLTARLLELGWFERDRLPRALRLTDAGRHGLATRFGCRLDD